jgi:hypothetical protein
MTRLRLLVTHRRAFQPMLRLRGIVVAIFGGRRRWCESRINNVITVTLFQKSVYDQQLGQRKSGFSILTGIE